MRLILHQLLILLALALPLSAQLKVAVLHPLFGEMAQAIGGGDVDVVNLFTGAGDLHEFAPTAADVAAAGHADLLLACGKGVEPYLPDLRQGLPAETRVVALGDTLPDAYLPESEVADPHWWNAPVQMQRAGRVLLRELCKADGAHRAAYEARYKAYAARTEQLHREAALSLSRIPRNRRTLITGHAAFCHWCAEFGFTPLSVYGVAQESEGDTASMARLLARLHRAPVHCLFTEAYERDRGLETLAEQSGAATRPLIMDGISPELKSYEAIFRDNIHQITEGLQP